MGWLCKNCNFEVAQFKACKCGNIENNWHCNNCKKDVLSSRNALNAKISKTIGLAPHAMFAIQMETLWKGVPSEYSKQTIGMCLNSRVVNVETLRIVGDAITVTSTILSSRVANVEILKIIGVVRIVIVILPSSRGVIAVTLKTTGTATIAIWKLRSLKLASAATKNDGPLFVCLSMNHVWIYKFIYSLAWYLINSSLYQKYERTILLPQWLLLHLWLQS